MSHSRRRDSDSTNVSNADTLAAIEKVGKRQDEFLVKLQAVECCVKDNTTSIRELTSSLEFTGQEVEDMKGKVRGLEQEVKDAGSKKTSTNVTR